MESRAKFLGHPLHQQLIVFPLGLLGMAVIFDLITFWTKNPRWTESAFYMIGAGIVTGLLAAVFGLVDWVAIPKNTRLRWGGPKNLLSGVTTVCHHNPRERAIFDPNFPVRVLKQFGWAHSLEFSPDVAERFRATPTDWPFILHLGEGVDRNAQREIFRLDELGVLDGRTVLVHAVALSGRGLRLAKQRGAALIWCPSSNLFLLGRTLNGALSCGIPVALGSDSAVTAKGDLLDELRVARRYLPASRLYSMVTTDAARILRLPHGFGAIVPGGPADLIAIADGGKEPAESLLRARRPEWVIIGGKVKLTTHPSPRLHRLSVEGRGTVFVSATVPRLTDVRLAGRRVLQ